MRTAAGTAPPLTRPPRRHDDGIESGEIVERRSLVVRSQKLQTVDWNEGPTEVATPSIPPPPKRDIRVPILIGSIIAGAVAIVLTLRAKPELPTLQGYDKLGGVLDNEANGAISRAQGIATAPVVRRAIDTDASTLADMARDRDVELALQPGELIEIHQVLGDQRTLLLRLPQDAKPLDPPPIGQARIDANRGHVVVVANAVVSNGRSKLAGEVVVAKTVDLTDTAKQIAKQASGAVLVGLSEPIALGKPAGEPNVRVPIATKTPVAGTLALAAVLEPRTASSWLAWLCMFLSAGLLAGFVVITVRARRA